MLVEKIYEVDSEPLHHVETFHFDPPERFDRIRTVIARQCHYRRQCVDKHLFGLPSPPMDEKYSLTPSTKTMVPPQPSPSPPPKPALSMKEIQSKLNALREEKQQLLQLIKRMAHDESIQKKEQAEKEERRRRLTLEEERRRQRRLDEQDRQWQLQREREEKERRQGLATKRPNRSAPVSDAPYYRPPTSSYYPPPSSHYSPSYSSKTQTVSGPAYRSHYIQKPSLQRPYY